MTGEQTTFSEVWRGEVSERGKTLKTTNHKQSWPTTEGEALSGGLGKNGKLCTAKSKNSSILT